jgi:hypothetical protein
LLTVEPEVAADRPESVRWFLDGRLHDCDNAFVAAYNAAVENYYGGELSGYDVVALADDALHRIETLARVAA